MMRVGQGDDQSEGSMMMMKNDKNLPPGFDDESSQGGFIRKVAIDDMSSQGSYLKRKKNNGFDDMQSEGSYMVRGYNGPADGQDLFNADDDDQSDIQLARGSLYESPADVMHGKDLDNSNKLKIVNSIQENANDDEVEVKNTRISKV